MIESHGIALYIDPPSHHFVGDRLFELFEGRYQSSLAQSCSFVRDCFTAKGIPVHTADYLPERTRSGGTPHRNVYVSLGRLSSYRRLSRRSDVILSAFLAMECPIVVPSMFRGLKKVQHYFRRVYSCMDSVSLEPFVGGPLRCEPIGWPQVFNRVHKTIWSQTDRKFLVMINVNKLPRLRWRELYTERMRAVAFFSRYGEIDLYGVGWDKPSMRVGETWMPSTLTRLERTLIGYWQRLRPDPLLTAARRVYRGQIETKTSVLGQYTFALCFENMILKGWITEKIFDCFFTGTIPIYWGAPDVETHIPPECFIDMRRFAGYDELNDYLKSLTAKDIQAYRESGRAYLESPQFRPYTKEAFFELFAQIIQEDTGIQLS
jgi:hypothetical protein